MTQREFNGTRLCDRNGANEYSNENDRHNWRLFFWWKVFVTRDIERIHTHAHMEPNHTMTFSLAPWFELNANETKTNRKNMKNLSIINLVDFFASSSLCSPSMAVWESIDSVHAASQNQHAQMHFKWISSIQKWFLNGNQRKYFVFFFFSFVFGFIDWIASRDWFNRKVRCLSVLFPLVRFSSLPSFVHKMEWRDQIQTSFLKSLST